MLLSDMMLTYIDFILINSIYSLKTDVYLLHFKWLTRAGQGK